MITAPDREILRTLAHKVRDIAELPIQQQRRELWTRHNSLKPGRPLILVFPEGSWQELLLPSTLQCTSDRAREIEWALRCRVYYHEHLRDDTVIEKEWVVHKVIHDSGWGLEPRHIASPDARGAWRFDPVIREPADLQKLRWPVIACDDQTTEQALAEAQGLFGDVLTVRLKGVAHLSYHLMNQYTGLRGLEEVMVDMYTAPQMLHDAMAFFEQGHRRVLEQYVSQNLLSLNNDSTYQSSGGNGYTDELPAPGFCARRVRPCDMWASAESQEMAQVGPKQHAEFALRYERRLLEAFGLTGYGCCEDLTRKLDDVLSIPHLRRISISPFANVDLCASRLKGSYIFSWKPRPSDLVGDLDEQRIRSYIRHTIEVAAAHGCVLEMILKDTHTCENHPERFDRWTQIARQEVNRVYGTPAADEPAPGNC